MCFSSCCQVGRGNGRVFFPTCGEVLSLCSCSVGCSGQVVWRSDFDPPRVAALDVAGNPSLVLFFPGVPRRCSVSRGLRLSACFSGEPFFLWLGLGLLPLAVCLESCFCLLRLCSFLSVFPCAACLVFFLFLRSTYWCWTCTSCLLRVS